MWLDTLGAFIYVVKSVFHSEHNDYDVRNLFKNRVEHDAERHFVNKLYKSIKLSEISAYDMLGNTDDKHGCVIVFSSTMNHKQSDIVAKLNRLTKQYNVTGYIIDYAMHGKYIERTLDTAFNKKSLTLELIGMSDEESIKLAKELCDVLKQQSILVRSINTKSIWCITKLK